MAVFSRRLLWIGEQSIWLPVYIWFSKTNNQHTRNKKTAHQIGVESKRLSTSNSNNSTLRSILFIDFDYENLWQCVLTHSSNWQKCHRPMSHWMRIHRLALFFGLAGCYLHCESSYIISNQKLWLFVQLVNIEMTTFLALDCMVNSGSINLTLGSIRIYESLFLFGLHCLISTHMERKDVENCVCFSFRCVSVPPNIEDSLTSTDVVAREGSNVTLKCRASGNPAPSIKWKR